MSYAPPPRAVTRGVTVLVQPSDARTVMQGPPRQHWRVALERRLSHCRHRRLNRGAARSDTSGTLLIIIKDLIRNGILQEVTNWAPSAAPSRNGLTDRVRVPCLVNAMARTAISAWPIRAGCTVHFPLTTTKPASPNGLTGSESPSDLTPHLRPPQVGAGVSPGENWQGGRPAGLNAKNLQCV
jgi:hypothetical protein